VEQDRKETETDIVTCVETAQVRDNQSVLSRIEFNSASDNCVWMAKDGTLTLYGNYHTPRYWLQYGTIYTPGELMNGHTRKDLFLADRELSL
jgi:hypothetical protein